MKPILLMFNFTGERRLLLLELSARLNAEAREIQPAGQFRTVAALLGAGSDQPAPGLRMPFSEELLLISGLPDPQLDRLLALWKQSGQAPIQKKAIVTPYNFAWTPLRLRDELAKEAR